MSPKYVYFFGDGAADGSAKLRDLLGGKGCNLAEMANLGLPVPPGFTVTTEVCTYFYAHGKTYPTELDTELRNSLAKLETSMGRKFGDPTNPLLVSVRSGARVSMPGMMDTVLNIGLNDQTIQGLATRMGERSAWDCYRRFVQMYGDVVLGLKPETKTEADPFEAIIEKVKHEKNIKFDTDLTTDDLKNLVRQFKQAVKDRLGKEFPDDAMTQLWGAIQAVFGSWNTPRANTYRQLNKIPEEWGTAVNVQAMVFGNTGLKSGTGVAFTRNPATGEKAFFGEYLTNAQGEDVVAGIRTPKPVIELNSEFPAIYQQLIGIAHKLEEHFHEMQDLEFTFENEKLFMLQTRDGKRTGFAAVAIAVDMVEEGLKTVEEALVKMDPNALNHLLQPIFEPSSKQKAADEKRIVAKGLAAGPGAATGKLVFFADEAEEWAANGEKVILVRIETSPEDIRGMNAAEGILTARGGMTSHAALVARQMGKVCVVACSALEIDYEKRVMTVGDALIKQGDFISIDGFTGELIIGKVDTKPSEVVQVLISKTLKAEESPVYRRFAKLTEWSKKHRTMGIRTNADQPDQAAVAIAFGAEGIGLCRTEHMFFGGDRIDWVRRMILADSIELRREALSHILPMQREDFAGIFRVMDGLPVTVRTLDPPLHEFLPHEEEAIKDLSEKMGISPEVIEDKVHDLAEANPMLGFRGCRLGTRYPEITEMQARALFEAACDVAAEGKSVKPEIMIPLVGQVTELALQETIVRETAEKVFAEKGRRVEYLVGTMIELPRAVVTADRIAERAEFFSFGTNDLTQTTFGLSRDDAGKFLPIYVEKKILPYDPFVTIDFEGVGALIRMGVEKGRSVRNNLKIGICGEHGGDPESVKFCHSLSMNYVSCSPFRVPIASLAAAQAAIVEKRKDIFQDK